MVCGTGQSPCATARGAAGPKPREQRHRRAGPTAIEFLGAWDTVDAYGLPVDELGVFVTTSSGRSACRTWLNRRSAARHALALDDERNTFHPKLWDDDGAAQPAADQPGLVCRHASDVGGGYPEEGLAHVSLKWMVDEAQAGAALHRTCAHAAALRTRTADARFPARPRWLLPLQPAADRISRSRSWHRAAVGP